MLLTETITNSTSAIKKRRAAIESKHHAETYAKALFQLAQTTESIKGTLDCAAAMIDSGIVNTPLMDESTRNDLIACINECGSGVSEMKIVWKDAAGKYAEGSSGYLSMIGGLPADPKRAKELADNISKAVAADPTIKGISSLISDVAEAKKIIEAFSLNPEIEAFLKKVSAQQATVLDLTPNILSWLKEKKLTSKLKIRF